ncbi:hypothetical protein Syun_025989 [Stephania yunnanensis]|uniref:Uncharacterized protein n=1 Tax=Stephania yunnanensis TaxID=152371 RepID=A0AAP0ET55_9MAGN
MHVVCVYMNTLPHTNVEPRSNGNGNVPSQVPVQTTLPQGKEGGKAGPRVWSEAEMMTQKKRDLRDWDVALLAFRSSIIWEWTTITHHFESHMHLPIRFIEFGDNRAFLFCTNYRDREKVVAKLKNNNSGMLTRVMKRSPNPHWNDPQIGGYNF